MEIVVTDLAEVIMALNFMAGSSQILRKLGDKLPLKLHGDAR